MFYSIYDNEIFDDIKLNDYKLAALGDSVMRMIPNDLNKPIFETYVKAAAPKEKAFLVTRKLLSADIETKNWSSALEKAKTFSSYFEGKNNRLNDLIYFLGALKNAPKPVIKEIPSQEEQTELGSEPKTEVLATPTAVPANTSEAVEGEAIVSEKNQQ